LRLLKKNSILSYKLLCLFTMVFLMIFSIEGLLQEAGQESKYLQKMTLCKDIEEKDPFQEVNFFFAQEEKVVSWIKFSYNSSKDFLLRWEWFTPQGKLYHQGEVKMEAGNYNNYRSWYWIKIKDRPASRLTGEWKVKVYINGLLVGEKTFYIIGSI